MNVSNHSKMIFQKRKPTAWLCTYLLLLRCVLRKLTNIRRLSTYMGCISQRKLIIQYIRTMRSYATAAPTEENKKYNTRPTNVLFPKILGFIWVTVARYDSHANGAREISHRLCDENTLHVHLQTIQHIVCIVLRKPQGFT